MVMRWNHLLLCFLCRVAMIFPLFVDLAELIFPKIIVVLICEIAGISIFQQVFLSNLIEGGENESEIIKNYYETTAPGL